MGVGLAGVAEEGVRDPDLAHHVAVEHQQLHGAVELQTAVVPRLSEEDVDGVLLVKIKRHIAHKEDINYQVNQFYKHSLFFPCSVHLHNHIYTQTFTQTHTHHVM